MADSAAESARQATTNCLDCSVARAMAEHLAHGVVAINELLQAVAFDIQIEPDDTAGRRGRAIRFPE